VDKRETKKKEKGKITMTDIVFKKRSSTTGIVVKVADKGGMSFKDLLKSHRQKGDFHVDDHFYIDNSGYIEAGRLLEDVAGFIYDDCNTSVHILVDGENGKINDCQQQSVNNLLTSLADAYPDAVVRWEREKKCQKRYQR